VTRYFSWSKIAKELSSKYRASIASHKYSSTMNNDVLAIDIPRPFWLAEKRVEANKNHNYYLIKNGVIKKEKL